MSKIARKAAKIFGSTALTNQIAQFGSLNASSPAFSTDPAVIQALSNWLTGWFSAVEDLNSPAIEDMNAFCYVIAYQIAYGFQSGIAEWDAGTTYFIGSLVNDGTGNIYASITNNNLNNLVSDPTNWKSLVLGTNTGDVTLAAVGSSPSANGASLSAQVLTLQPADATHPGLMTSGTQNIGGIKTFSTQLIGKGTASNDNAASGYVGEYMESLISSATSVGTSDQFFDLTSLALTAGDWDVQGMVRYAANGSTFTSTDLYVGIGTATGNSGTGTVDGINTAEDKGVAPTTFLLHSLSVPSYRVSIASPTTYYLKGIVGTYTVGTPKYLCRMSARRVR